MTIRLVNLAAAHEDALAGILCDPRVSGPLFGLPQALDACGAARFVDERLRILRAGRGWTFVLAAGSEVVGMASLLPIGEGACELGICVRPPDWCRGFARAGLAQLLEHASRDGVVRVLARCGRANRRSISLMLRGGFKEMPGSCDVVHTWRNFECGIR